MVDVAEGSVAWPIVVSAAVGGLVAVGKYLVLHLLAVRPITIRFVFLCDV